MKNGLIITLTLICILGTACSPIEDDANLDTPTTTTTAIESDVTTDIETDSSSTVTASVTTPSNTTATTTDVTTTTEATTITTTEDTTTTTTETTTTEVTTTTTMETTQTTVTTTEEPLDVQLTPDEMLQEMFESKGALTLCYVDEDGEEYTNTIDCVDVEYIRMYLSDCKYVPDNVNRKNPSNSYVSISLEYQDLFGDLCCKETITIYDVTLKALLSGNCWITVDIYDPDGGMYYNSSDNYATDVSDMEGLFAQVVSMLDLEQDY